MTYNIPSASFDSRNRVSIINWYIHILRRRAGGQVEFSVNYNNINRDKC